MKNRRHARLLTLLSLALSLSHAEARRLKVLFLGHEPGMHPGHQTEQRFMDLLEGVVSHGVDMDFVTQPSVALQSEKLASYDALAIYANWEKITPEQEKALFSYVEGGKGLVALHCASYCFLNSMPYTQMVGARFKSHATGEFDVNITNADHPIMQGFQNFRTWDETYVHTYHNDDKIVLQRRVDAAKGEDEPWTWVRNQGQGRVFYTAYGHNERTWKQPGFHELVYRGIKWAVGEKAGAEHAKLVLPPLEYVDGAAVPNYERRNPPPKLQKPLSPEDAQKRISVGADMELSLFASEKDGLWNVIEFKFDERGRMWTCESLDYPNERKPQGEGRDRIRILEDYDGDGKVDKASIFAEKLSIPTSLVFADDGIIITNLPDTTFLKDTNGDGVADERKVLFTGWGVGDTHACPSSLVYGPDGWIYGCVGYSGFSGVVGGKQVKLGQSLFRFAKDGSALEKLGSTSNNTWGFALNENGDIFASTANNQSSLYCAIPTRYYEKVPGLKQEILPGIDLNKRAPIIRPYIRQVDVFGGFTAAACHNFYTARSFPQDYWNSIAFVAEPTCHLLYQALTKQKGTESYS
jgi:putative membrane-bound dehydrogenase-like protein